MISLSLWWLATRLQETSSNRLSSKLSYYIEHPSDISLDPLESDYTPNAILMKHLVGTLVRYANGGQFEPYLAKSFTSENQGRLWRFRLRRGLTCQDGELISARGYVQGFLDLARTYAKNGPVPAFSDIVGWESFANGGQLDGLRAGDDEEVVFEFEKPVSTGFLEYLSMPYYGYFCRSNFKLGVWRTVDSIVSSGPYTLASLSEDKKTASLELRADWPLAVKHAPRMVTYHGRIEPAAWHSNSSIVQTNLAWAQEEPEKFRKFSGPPDLVRAVVLDDGPSHHFFDKKNRQVFQAKVRELQARIPFRSKSANLTRYFYPSTKVFDKSPTTAGNTKSTPRPKRPLSVFTPTIESDESKYILTLVKTALEELSWPYTLLTPTGDGKLKAIDVAQKGKFDIRVTSVVAGSVVEPWVVEMMFCSSMGVSYPDPSGNVCRKIKSILDSQITNIDSLGDEVSSLIESDAAVIPVYHGRTTWYFSRNLDVSRIAGDLIMPSFEDIGVND